MQQVQAFCKLHLQGGIHPSWADAAFSFLPSRIPSWGACMSSTCNACHTYTEIAPDQKYTFGITATDGDGDVTTAQVLSIQQTSAPPAVGAATDGGAVTTALTDMQDASPYVLI